MSRSSNGRAHGRPHGRALGRGAAALLGVALGARALGAQPPAAPPAPPAPPAAGDSTARASAARDSAARGRAPGGAARADTARAGVSDSTQRDSVVARQRRAERARRDPGSAARFALDRLRLTTVGLATGVAAPDQVRPAALFAVQADYGELARDVRAVFGVTYWTSQFTRGAVDGFARAVAAAAAAPGGAPVTVAVGRVRASDVALHGDARWRPRRLFGRRAPGSLRPWASAGGGVHLLDVQGAPISGTFVERALDGVAFGAALALGADLLPSRTVQLTGQARYDLFNGAHYASLRAGVSYGFDRRRP